MARGLREAILSRARRGLRGKERPSLYKSDATTTRKTAGTQAEAVRLQWCWRREDHAEPLRPRGNLIIFNT